VRLTVGTAAPRSTSGLAFRTVLYAPSSVRARTALPLSDSGEIQERRRVLLTDTTRRSAVVLDRHPLWLDGLGGVLTGIGVELAAKTTSPGHALAAIREHRPDLFITEVESADPSIDGIACLRHAADLRPELKAIVLSAEDNPQLIEAALDAGAAAYVVKTAHPDDIAAAVRQVFEHSVYLPPVRESERAPQLRRRADALQLTPREQEIVRLVAEGYSNGQLARLLWVTEQTVKFHLSNIYRKLGVANRTEAARWAQINGYVTPQRKVVA
jgi:DNA-binding NarL/FixJ family response regulator